MTIYHEIGWAKANDKPVSFEWDLTSFATITARVKDKKRSISSTKLVLVFLLMLFARQSFGQQTHYLYIKSGDRSPFYVKSGQKTFESSGNGYLVMEGLVSASYTLVIGYRNNPAPEWSFPVSVNENDLAFTLIKKAGVPLLTALGSKAEISGSRVSSVATKDIKQEPLTGPVSDDPFSRLLADVVEDQTIRLKPMVTLREPLVTTPVVPPAAAPVTTTDKIALPESVKESLASKTKPKDSVFTVSTNNKAIEKVDSAVTSKETTIAQNALPAPEEKVTLPEPPKAIVKTEQPKIDAAKADSASTITAAQTPDQTATTVPEQNTVSDVAVKDVIENEGKEEVRPFVLREVVKNIKKGKKKEEEPEVETTASPKFPISVSIKKTLQKKSTDGIELIYVDEVSPGNKETIRILIPAN